MVTGVGGLVLYLRRHTLLSILFTMIMAWLITSIFAIVWPSMRQLLPIIYIICIFASLRINDTFGIIMLVLSAIIQTGFTVLSSLGWIDTTLKLSNPWLQAVLYTLLFIASYFFLKSYNLTISSMVNQFTSFSRRYRALLQSSSDGVLLINLDHRVAEANPRAAKILGYPLHELVNLPLEAICEDIEGEYQLFDSLLKGDHVPITEKRLSLIHI